MTKRDMSVGKRIKAINQIALVNRMVQGGMNHAAQRIASKIEVKMVEAAEQDQHYLRGLSDAKEIALGEIKAENL